MNFSSFYGNEPIKTALEKHLFHAYLIEGPEGSGKHTLADLITNALVCDGPNPPCGSCRQCYKIRQKCHPDVIDIPSDIPVDDLRQLLSGIVLTPNDAKHKIYRIDKAENLHPSAQNLLLKTLEEPPSYAVFILLCTAKEGLLQTVRSRCQTLSPAPLPEETIREHFIKVYGEYNDKARGAALLSAGYLGKALSLYESEEPKELNLCNRLDLALRKRDKAEVLRIFSFADRGDLAAFYTAFSLHIKRKLRESSGTEQSFYAKLTLLWDGAGRAIQTNVNVNLWNTNLARLCLRATQD